MGDDDIRAPPLAQQFQPDARHLLTMQNRILAAPEIGVGTRLRSTRGRIAGDADAGDSEVRPTCREDDVGFSFVDQKADQMFELTWHILVNEQYFHLISDRKPTLVPIRKIDSPSRAAVVAFTTSLRNFTGIVRRDTAPHGPRRRSGCPVRSFRAPSLQPLSDSSAARSGDQPPCGTVRRAKTEKLGPFG